MHIIVNCEKCNLTLPQCDFQKKHNLNLCLEAQLESKNTVICNLEGKVKIMKTKLDYYESVMEKIIKGECLQLNIEFQTSFPMNFQFNSQEVKLIKASWNAAKEKFDFLHFYITYPIKTESLVGSEWKLHVKTLQGNLLIGVCSSLCPNSVDFVINKFGEIKKKEWN